MTLLSPPEPGLEKRIIIDFGDLYVGYLSLILKASRGTILDIYGFENMYQGEVDYTIGLNNGARYICREGWQSYTSMAKMGMRYAMIRVVFGEKNHSCYKGLIFYMKLIGSQMAVFLLVTMNF